MSKLSDLLNKAREQNAFWESSVQADIASQLLRLLKQSGMSQARLADALQVNPAYVSRVLSGGENLSIKTMIKIARALNRKLKVDFVEPKVAATPEKPAASKFNLNAAMVFAQAQEKYLADFQRANRGWHVAEASNEMFISHSDERAAVAG